MQNKTTERADRLREARQKSGFSSASEFARKFGFPEATYRAHENGQRNLTEHMAQVYAEKLGSSFNWLMFGGDSPPAGNPAALSQTMATGPAPRDFPLMGYAQAMDADSIPTALEKRPIKLLERPPQFLGVDDGFAVIVAGSAMSPRFENKDLLYINPRLMAAVDDDVLIEMNDGGIALRRIMAIDADSVTLRQYQPKKDTKFLKTQYRRLMRVVMVARE